ncbi:hypothetical protein EDD15DRAFT_2371473 [Pisolithus albus]|nr:hypothetical protein EDD15DRAFT_2371473 [Pisolithus albus]
METDSFDHVYSPSKIPHTNLRPESINRMTVTDDDPIPLASHSMEAEIAKIDEQAQQQCEKEEQDWLHKEEEDMRKKWKEAAKASQVKGVMVGTEEDSELAGDEAVAAKTIRWASLAGLATQHHCPPILHDNACTKCITTSEQCFNLPDLCSKQCEKCFRQKKGCPLHSKTAQGKQKDSGLSHCAGEQRKHVKVISEDHDTQLASTSSACALGTLAGATSDVVAEVYKVANADRKVMSPERDKLAEEGGNANADGDGDNDTHLSGSMAN